MEGVVVRPSTTIGDEYEDVAQAWVRAVHSALTGTSKAREAVAGLERDLIRITGFETGRP